MRFKMYRQLNAMDCGPTCLRMIAQFYGRHFTLETLRNLSGFNKNGVSLSGISQAAQKIGFSTTGIRISVDDLIDNFERPCIAHWNQNHFVVIVKKSGKKVLVADPSVVLMSYTTVQMKEHFSGGIHFDQVEVSFGPTNKPPYMQPRTMSRR